MDTYPLALRARARAFPSTPIFLVLWVPCGFVLGTLTLLGPVRWWAKVCRFIDLSQRVEDGGVFLMIGALFMVSGYTARIITNVLEVSSRAHRVAAGAAVIALCGATVAAWMHPALMTPGMAAEQHGDRFTFGPYPDETRLRQLKKDGYTVVSLLHPAVVPFEPKLIHDEDKLARGIGVPVIHIPMLPWISGNAEAIARIRKLATDRTRHFYVHCYLGQDRVRIVRRTLEQAGVSLAAVRTTPQRSIRNASAFERGPIYRLEPGVYVTGYPTNDEFVRYVLSGEIRQVVAFLDPDAANESAAIDQERALLQQHGVPFTLYAANRQRFDPDRVQEAVRAIERMEKPVLVHAFTAQSPWTDGFIQTWTAGRRSLPSSLFDLPVTHVAIGPRPARSQFAVLARRGVVECIHVGRERVPGDSRAAARAGLRWRSVRRGELVAAVRTGGPYYIYGSDAAKGRAGLQRAYRKPVALKAHN